MDQEIPKNAYHVLGVTPHDDIDTIRKAWRALARAYHPDVVGGCPHQATLKFAEINDAYDVLRFHRKRIEGINPIHQAARESFYAVRRREARRRAEEAQKSRQQAEAARRADARLQAEADAHARRSAPGPHNHDEMRPVSSQTGRAHYDALQPAQKACETSAGAHHTTKARKRKPGTGLSFFKRLSAKTIAATKGYGEARELEPAHSTHLNRSS